MFRTAVEQGLSASHPTPETWWKSQWRLAGRPAPRAKEQELAITRALAAWVGVVDGLTPEATGTAADHLRAAWDQLLASGQVPPEQLDLAQRAWRWREHLQRVMDGCRSTSVQSAQGLALYTEAGGGVHCALPAGMQVGH